jgi:hypothetical protein
MPLKEYVYKHIKPSTSRIKQEDIMNIEDILKEWSSKIRDHWSFYIAYRYLFINNREIIERMEECRPHIKQSVYSCTPPTDSNKSYTIFIQDHILADKDIKDLALKEEIYHLRAEYTNNIENSNIMIKYWDKKGLTEAEEERLKHLNQVNPRIYEY